MRPEYRFIEWVRIAGRLTSSFFVNFVCGKLKICLDNLNFSLPCLSKCFTPFPLLHSIGHRYSYGSYRTILPHVACWNWVLSIGDDDFEDLFTMSLKYGYASRFSKNNLTSLNCSLHLCLKMIDLLWLLRILASFLGKSIVTIVSCQNDFWATHY